MTVELSGRLLQQNKTYNFNSVILQQWIMTKYLGYDQLSGYHQFQPLVKQDYKTDPNFIENIHPTVIYKYVKEL